MANMDFREASAAVLRSISEEELARWYRENGRRIVQFRGRPWMKLAPGFYQPVHWLARFTKAEVGRPSPFCWGFRACLHEEDHPVANGSMPVHMLTDLEEYSDRLFSSNRRYQLRKCRKAATIVELTSPELLWKQGYKVVVSALERGAYRSIPVEKDYRKSVEKYMRPGRMVVAALVDGELKGYMSGVLVDGTAYCEEQYVASDALWTNAAIGMTYEYVQACRRGGETREIVNGLHAREDEGLCTFKKSIAFPVKPMPARTWIMPPIDRAIRWRAPHKYYRLTGSC